MGQNDQGVKIEIKLSPLKNVIASGETLQLNAEIWNEGSADVYVCKDFESPAGPLCRFALYLEDSTGRHGSKYGLAADIDPWHIEPLSAALARDWTALRHDHHYGAIVRVDSDSFPGLRKPGTYRVIGTFSSGGLLAYPPGTILSDPEEVAHLPAKFWRGKMDSNSVVVRVTPGNE
jgi:hypothetical protein